MQSKSISIEWYAVWAAFFFSSFGEQVYNYSRVRPGTLPESPGSLTVRDTDENSVSQCVVHYIAVFNIIHVLSTYKQIK